MAELYSNLMDNPLAILEHGYDEAFQLTPAQIARFQKHWISKRFADLRARLPVLDKLATEQGIGQVREIDDIVPLLFAHTVYKSYPMSFLEKNRFERLTKWLSGLTTSDLSAVDAKGIESIDDWIDLLDAKTDLMVLHTSGTTGKLSFLPRTRQQSGHVATLASNILRDWNGKNTRADMLVQHRPVINPGYRYGAGTAQRMAGVQAAMYAGGDDNTLFLYADRRLSADMISLAGRIRVAEARGELGALTVPAALLQRRAAYVEQEQQRPAMMAHFFETAANRFAGQDVYIGGVYGTIYDWAHEGTQRGLSKIFGQNSFLSCGGGMKGRTFPDGWRQTIQDFLGFNTFSETFAMTESMCMSTLCAHGHYHMPPFMVPFLLDPKTGKQLPRKDKVRGRLGFMDLLPDSYWAGLVTGDEVTMGGFEQPCACGRSGAYLHTDIRRYSEQEGGDDKVLCGGAPEAHDKAMAFLADAGQ